MKYFSKLQLGLMVAVSCTLGAVSPVSANAKLDIVDTAASAGEFSILVKAIQAAGLQDALKGDGPFTVLAPNDEAFRRLPKGTIANLLKPENKEQLVSILKYHVIAGKVEGANAVSLKQADTLAGLPLSLSFKNAALYVNDAKVIATDISTKNGVIHVIDSVLIPNIVQPDSESVACENILKEAVDVGVDLFNDGDPKSCAAVYAIALKAVWMAEPSSLDASERKAIESALAKVKKSKDTKKNAWTLRYAINATMVNLSDED